jgi:hypothetical protein
LLGRKGKLELNLGSQEKLQQEKKPRRVFVLQTVVQE